MSDLIPTIRVKRDGPKGYHIINASDFDPAKHEAYDAAADTDNVDLHKMKVEELKALAADRLVDLGDNTKKADIIAALELADEENARLDEEHEDAGGLSLRQLHADIAGLGLEVDPALSAAELLALRDETRAAREAA